MQLPNISSWRAKWTVGSLLGKGAFAAVFPAVPPPGETHKMPLVVKVATDEKGDQMISEEENAYNNLRHAFREALQGVPVVAPNRYIPDFEGCWRTTETPRRYFLVLERLHAGLDDYLLAEKVAGRWNSPVIKDAALQMFDALSALSLRGYAHRDVKLENFGVRKKDNGVEIVLFDLGMTTLITAWELEKASRNKAVMGTIPFLSIRAAERYSESLCSLLKHAQLTGRQSRCCEMTWNLFATVCSAFAQRPAYPGPWTEAKQVGFSRKSND